MSNLVNIWLWCNGHMLETYKSDETLPGGWKCYCITMDNNSDPNEPWVSSFRRDLRW